MDAKQLLENYNPAQIMASLKLERLRRDFAYCAANLLKVAPKHVSDTGGLVPFYLNRAQIEMNKVAEAQLKRDGWVRMCLLKHRQPGGSTWASGWGYRMTALTPHTHGMIFAQDDQTSQHIMDIVKRFYDNTPPQYKPRQYARPADGLEFMDPDSPPKYSERRQGSTIKGQTARTAMAGTGHTLQFVQLSEAAKYLYARELWTNMSPAIPDAPNTVVIKESTAYHSGEWFREECEKAQYDEDYPDVFLFTPWYLSDEYRMPLRPGETLKLTLEEKQRVKKYGLELDQIKWYRYKLNSLGGDDIAFELMKQEYPEVAEDAWIDMTASTFDRRKLYGVLKEQAGNPLRVCDIESGASPSRPHVYDNPSGFLSIWEEPQGGEIYDIGVDVATGDEGSQATSEGETERANARDKDLDWSVCAVYRRRDRTQVAEWRSKSVDPVDLAQVAANLGMYYNTAQLGVEVTGIGYVTNAQLHKLGYPNMYIWRTRGEAADRLTRQTGWMTSPTSKNFLVAKMRHYVVTDKVTIRSPVLWQEMTTFVRYVTDNGTVGYGAPTGYHDDTVMASMIAIVIGDDERHGDGFEAPQEKPVDRNDVFKNYVQRELQDNYDFALAAQGDPLRDLADMLDGRL